MRHVCTVTVTQAVTVTVHVNKHGAELTMTGTRQKIYNKRATNWNVSKCFCNGQLNSVVMQKCSMLPGSASAARTCESGCCHILFKLFIA